MGSISIRQSLCWLPGEASEPTSTLVLTSPQRRFVDLRIVKPVASLASASAGHGEQSDELPLHRLDWAIAGTSSSSMRDDGHGRQVPHSQWRHWIDSRTAEADEVVDEADTLLQADGSTLEMGSMVNPATGRESRYEEVWHDAEAAPIPASSVPCVVLQMDDGHGRGMVVRLGQYCQGVSRRADALAVERWQWSAGSGWRRTVRIGSEALPCAVVLEADGADWVVGSAAGGGHEAWTVVEVTRLTCHV